MHYVLSAPEQTDYVRVAVAVWAALGLFVIALSIASIVWVWRDVTARADDLVVRAAALVPYVLLRPQDTREERLQHQLEMEACRRELDEYVPARAAGGGSR